MKKIKLPEDYAAVLLLIKQAGQTELSNIAESLRFDRARLKHIMLNLQHKGLIRIRRSSYGAWVSLSHKGLRALPLLLQANASPA
ncbi:MAG TPA: hypothetical protein VF466_01780 [Candidatus Saccharimonadales bacterium]